MTKEIGIKQKRNYRPLVYICSPFSGDVEDKPTNQEMQNEYNYYLAEQCTRKLLDQGLITIDEFNKIQEKNRRTFSPFLSKILP